MGLGRHGRGGGHGVHVDGTKLMVRVMVLSGGVQGHGCEDSQLESTGGGH